MFGEWSSVMEERKNVNCFPVPSFGVPVVSFDPWLGWKLFLGNLDVLSYGQLVFVPVRG